MHAVLFLLLLCRCFVVNSGVDIKKRSIQTIYGNDEVSSLKKTFEINVETENVPESVVGRNKRAVSLDSVDPSTKINHLNDTHKQLMVHWVGEKSRVVICLARDPTSSVFPDPQPVSPSAVYISYDDGDTYENKTDSFKLPNGSYATLEKFYNHPKYNTHFVFTDVRHNKLYVTKDHGRNFKMIDLDFTPSELSFHELRPSTYVILDKKDGRDNRLYITEDFGTTFRLTHGYVKSFFWLKDTNNNQELIVQRYSSNDDSTTNVLHSRTLYKSYSSLVYNVNVKDLYLKNDYIFSTKESHEGKLELYVSFQLGKQILCVFDSDLKFLNYLIVDVTGNRALIAVSHSNTQSNLYVSENLAGNEGQVKFTLSLPDIFAYFPNNTWSETWLQHVSDEAFADVYKVEGLSGIYIASRVVSNTSNSNLSPQNLGSVITFDNGASWRLIQPPADDIEGQSTSCLPSKGCSLHLSQKFSQLHPETRSISILSTKSAPGIIMATGVLGQSLKGHYGIYISLDAGLTWRQTLRDLYFFNMGDHGGILTAVKYYRTKGETRHILYSIDEGETWNQTIFHNEDIRLYGLMTEPGENTTVFTMFGSLPKEHRWIIVKVDFQNVFKSQCKPDDYKMWSPSQSEENRSYIPCILGEQTTYQRRMPHALCLNGLDYVHVVSKQVCDCDLMDFECDFGFKKDGQPPHCIRDYSVKSYDPYSVPKDCKPNMFYNRTKGYRKISGDVCVQGFESQYLPDLVPCPFNEVNDFLLFAQRERISRFNLATKRMEELPIKNLKNVIAIDFDIQNNCVYWADIALDVIGRQCFANGSKAEMLVSNDLASIEGMAYDWISKTLYFVDGVRAKIELIKTDVNHSGRMRKIILDDTVLRKPRGIALHPQNGYMFWTDWSAENPSVNRANLDGTNNLTLFGKDKVEWPNGIAIDYIANRIYWVDARRDYIGSSDLHGDGFVKVVSDSDVVSHPFAVAVFKDNMYWDDWKINSIFSADKNHFKGVEIIVQQLAGLMDLKVYAHGIQIGTNACMNSTCPYICVGLPKNKHACLCPDGMQMRNNKCLCPGNVDPLRNWSCPTVDKSCSPDHFVCGNGACIPKGWKCDGEDDCGDSSDEAHCGIESCPPNFHSCGDGKCLPSYWRCDYDNDCADGSDEMNCPRQNCTAGQFTCDNGRCISMKWKCDMENDCRDNSDERNCNPDRPQACKNDEFQCKGGAVTCIPSTWKCDGESDCRDSSDETDCSHNNCTSAQFSCGSPNNRCIYNTWVCDGDRDCPNGRDEENCTTTKPYFTKPPPQFIPENGICHDWMFKCKNNKCIPFWWKCDTADDCGDGSDEMGCPDGNSSTVAIPTTAQPSTPAVCGSNHFQCLTGECILSAWVCDNMADCRDGEDEEHCENQFNCTSDQFKCRADGSCIQRDKVCDGLYDCPDQSDELACEHNLPNGPATPSCSIGFFPCDGSCSALAVLCDGRPDCKDGYDELNCKNKSRVYQVMQMYNDERGTNGTVILLSWWMPTPHNVMLEFLPSICKVGENKWKNMTWTDNMEYQFTDLQPFTKYNMTVYVKIQNTENVFPPAKYLIISTEEGIPSAPWNVTATQKNGSHVLISWNKPVNSNGVISNYQIIWAPPNSSEIRLKLSGNETSHLLSADFEHDGTYTFYVTAFNRKHESNKSAPAFLKFDGETNLNSIKYLTVTSVTNTSISLAWKYDGQADGFKINIKPEISYPKIPPAITRTPNCTIQLAPGASYSFKVYAFKNSLEGTPASISASTTGTRLSEITNLDAIVSKEVGTTVKLSWQRLEKSGKVSWIYGVYYGITADQLFSKPMARTTNLTATITNLEACETYIFAVGLVGPYGFGPLSKNIKKVTTSGSPKAKPKRVQAAQVEGEPLKMQVSWLPSCPESSPNDAYVLYITEKTTNIVWHVMVHNSLSYVFNIEYGGIYVIRVSTAVPNATFTQPITFKAPFIHAPLELNVVPERNGSYFIYWKESELPVTSGPYKYEVLVQDGNKLDERTAQKFIVDKPPLIYTNLSSSIYTFAVRIKTNKGFASLTTSSVSKLGEQTMQSSVNLPAIVIPGVIILLALVSVITFLIIRNRRLHNSFVRFANSHYNTRSGAATFDDNSLEEEESPRIVGFSDDEPLVIA